MPDPNALDPSPRGHDAASVAAGERRWRRAFLLVFAGLLLLKSMLAATLAPFGDEAFYWQESRHLALGYSDLPPLTAWLIRLGENIAGHGVFGMRWPFLLLGSALPWLLIAFARSAAHARANAAGAESAGAAQAKIIGWQAGLLCLLLPLAGSLGVLALPDVPLTVAIMLALYALLRAMAENRPWQWLLLGLALAVCWMTHYRAAMPMLAGLLLCVLTPRGRAQWRRGGFWLAMCIAALGLLPLIVSNLQQRGAGVAFQLVERNPWEFHADALVQPLEQALACTPLLYGLLLWAAWRCWRRRGEGAPYDVIALVSASFIGLYFVLGLFADNLRFRAHWPLPGYLPLLAVLPATLAENRTSGRRVLVFAALTLAAIGQLIGLAYLGLAATAVGTQGLAASKAFPANFVGWRESGAAAAELLRATPSDVLVADNFMLAAELDFQLAGRWPIYALDSPLNAKHGRAAQLAIWQRDETALRQQHAGAALLLAVDETALRERVRRDWLGSLCARIDAATSRARLDLFGGRKRVAFYRGFVPAAMPPPLLTNSATADQCLIWQRAYAASRGMH